MKLRLILLALFTLFVSASAFGQGAKNASPCADAQSQAEMNICAGNLYKKADGELNRTYQKLVAMLDDEEKASLKLAQNAWLKYRDANCDFVADQYKGGSMRPMILGLCLAGVTENRTAELKDQIKDRNN